MANELCTIEQYYSGTSWLNVEDFPALRLLAADYPVPLHQTTQTEEQPTQTEEQPDEWQNDCYTDYIGKQLKPDGNLRLPLIHACLLEDRKRFDTEYILTAFSSDDEKLVSFINNRFAEFNYVSPSEVDMDNAYWAGWNAAIVEAIDSEKAWLAFDMDSESECPDGVGLLHEQAELAHESLRNKTNRAIVFCEITVVDNIQLSFLEGKERCLYRICKHYPVEDDIDMVAMFQSFLQESISICEYGGEFTLFCRKKEVVETKKRSRKPDMYHVPGFIDEVMQLTLSSAPYPSKPLAFCGAMSLLSFLLARKVSFHGLYSNLYLLALASSGSGKDFPRRVNNHIFTEFNKGSHLCDSIASGEGLEDSMFRNTTMLYQLDEFDSLIAAMASDKESRFTQVSEKLLKFYTSSGSTFYLRQKANCELQRSIANPSLSIFATCTPSSFFDALSSKLLKNGLMARCIVIQSGDRGDGRKPKKIELTESIRQQVEHWLTLGKDAGNIGEFSSDHIELEASSDAQDALDRLQAQCDDQWKKTSCDGAKAIWARCHEHACKLSMLYACSSNAQSPAVGIEAVAWATALAQHCTVVLLKSIADSVFESDFDKLLLKLKKRLKTIGDWVLHSELLKYSKVDARNFAMAITTLRQRGEIDAATDKTRTKPIDVYRIVEME